MSEPGASGEERIAAIRRWEEWLQRRVEGDVLRVEANETATDDVTWTVEFSERDARRVRVSPAALSVRGDAFEQLTERLDEEDWQMALDAWRAIRIHEDGTVEEVAVDEA